MHHSRVGNPDNWDHEVTILAPDSPSNTHVVTPDAGRCRISYVDLLGVEKYWNGAAFVAGGPIDLATTISGTRSQYNYTHPAEVGELVVTFEGTLERGGRETPWVTIPVYVEFDNTQPHYVDS